MPNPLLKLPSTCEERFALLSRLIADWYDPVNDGDGFEDADFERSSTRLGLPIPAALRRWYQMSGRRKDVWSLQDILLPPEQWNIQRDALEFCVENQHVTSWGISRAQLLTEDPPVLVRDGNDWLAQSASVSEFVLHFFAYTIKFSERASHINGYAPPDCRQHIISNMPSLDFPIFVWTGTRLFGTDDLIVGIDESDHVSASARSSESLQTFRELIEATDFEGY